MITDQRAIQRREPIICYWFGVTIGEAALCTLTDLFTGADYKATVPGADGWNWMDAEDRDRPAADQLHLFLKKHGSKVLQVKWQRFRAAHKHRVYWDQREKCFKPTAE